MNKSYRKEYNVYATEVDRYGRLKPSAMLLYIQNISGLHCDSYSLTYEELASRGIFWAVIRHRVEINRLPMEHETITLETWPMPTTAAAYPRSTVATDEKGNVLFRSHCLWVLMDLKNRTMLLPKKSGVVVDGFLRGDELSTPRSLIPKALEQLLSRQVVFSDLDRNGHMNNARYLDWLQDLNPSSFHEAHPIREVNLCYLNEALEGQNLDVRYGSLEDGFFHVDIQRTNPEDPRNKDRIFAAKVRYE